MESVFFIIDKNKNSTDYILIINRKVNHDQCNDCKERVNGVDGSNNEQENDAKTTAEMGKDEFNDFPRNQIRQETEVGLAVKPPGCGAPRPECSQDKRCITQPEGSSRQKHETETGVSVMAREYEHEVQPRGVVPGHEQGQDEGCLHQPEAGSDTQIHVADEVSDTPIYLEPEAGRAVFPMGDFDAPAVVVGRRGVSRQGPERGQEPKSFSSKECDFDDFSFSRMQSFEDNISEAGSESSTSTECNPDYFTIKSEEETISNGLKWMCCRKKFNETFPKLNEH